MQGPAFTCPGLVQPQSPDHVFLLVTPQHLDLAALALLTTDQALLEALRSPQPYDALCASAPGLQVSLQPWLCTFLTC